MSQHPNGAERSYMVTIAEPANSDGALIFTFVPSRRKDLEGNRKIDRVPQYIVRAHQESDEWKLDWSQASDDPGLARQEIETEIHSRLQERSNWVNRVSKLVQEVEQWARDLGWSSRRVEKRLEDSRVGNHRLPALLLQEDTCRVLLEPVGRSTPGAEGVVDLYLMPAYDDIASLYYYGNQWNLHYMFAGTPTVATIRDAESVPLSKAVLERVLSEMRQNVA